MDTNGAGSEPYTLTFIFKGYSTCLLKRRDFDHDLCRRFLMVTIFLNWYVFLIFVTTVVVEEREGDRRGSDSFKWPVAF